jgi:HAD superfamily hydrolase (TIGR01509 family)
MYRAILLDIDGTLIDSNDAHAQAWVMAFASQGRRVELARVRPLIGKGGDKLLAEVAGIDIESDEGKSLGDLRREIFQRDFLPHLQPTRGAKVLLERMAQDGLRLVIATSAQAAEVKELLQVASVSHLIYDASSSDDAKDSKPDPDIVHAALRKAGCDPGDALMIGDTPYDVEAASRAGVISIALRCGGWWQDEALAGALAIYDDPQDLLDNYDRSRLKQDPKQDS